MREFWDARAREDALFFVDDRLPYRQGDIDTFFAQGERDLDAVLDQVDAVVRPGDDVVDLGCGVGRLTRPLAARASTVSSIDVSAEMLERAQRLNPGLENVRWLHGDGVSLAPVEDAAADVLISHVVFQHIPDPAVTMGYVAEMGRVLRPGGWAAFQVSNDPEVHRRSRRLTLRLKALLGRAPRGQGHRAWLGSAVDLAVLERTAKGAGMDVERVTGAGTQYCFVLLRSRADG